MTKYASIGTELKIGVKQVETATIVGTLTGSGNATVTLTVTGMTGSALAVTVALLEDDTPTASAAKMATQMNTDSDITDWVVVTSNGPYLIITRATAAANDASMNIAYIDDTCTGLTADSSSDNTTAGVVLTTIAQVKSFDGPDLSLDTDDVTTHDSTGGFEEFVATILRTGEISFEIVYDPAGATHDATSGLIYYEENKVNVFFDFIFRSTYNWTFDGLVTGFKPSDDHGSASTADVKAKITGQPTLE